MSVPLTDTESAIGWYQNPAPWQDNVLVFTSESIYLVEGERTERLPLSEIFECETPLPKRTATGVRVLTPTGHRFIRCAGQFGPTGNQKDAFSLLMFLRAVVDENRRAAASIG